MNKSIEEKFEKYFQEWLEEIQKPEIMVSSNSKDYTDNTPYRKIIRLGKPALRYLMGKIAQGYFFLNHAVSEITGLKISDIAPADVKPTSQQEISRLWLNWWNRQKPKNIRQQHDVSSWADFLSATLGKKSKLTDEDILRILPIYTLERLEHKEIESIIEDIRKNLDKPLPFNEKHPFFSYSKASVSTMTNLDYLYLVHGLAASIGLSAKKKQNEIIEE